MGALQELNMKHLKWFDWLIWAILLISPIVVNLILGISIGAPVYGSTEGWLNFYGTLVGTFIPLYMLYRTRMWNKEDNETSRQLQYDILKYNRQKEWFQSLKKQLDENYQVIDMQNISTVCLNIQLGAYERALPLLMELNRQIEMQGYRFDLYFPIDNRKVQEEEYASGYTDVLFEYGNYVNDLMLICNIHNIVSTQLSEVSKHLKTYINSCYASLENIEQQATQIKVTGRSKILPQLIALPDSADYLNRVMDICEKRMKDLMTIHLRKEELLKITNQLLKYEELAIDKIISIS